MPDDPADSRPTPDEGDQPPPRPPPPRGTPPRPRTWLIWLAIAAVAAGCFLASWLLRG